MNKTYLAIILALLALVVLVGGYAVYKANNPSMKKLKEYSSTPVIVTITPTPTPVIPKVPDKLSEIPLTITTVKDGDKYTTDKLTVTGTTSPKAEVNVNGTDYIADANGKFTAKLTLDEGENTIFVTAINDKGDVSEWEATVTYEPAQ